MFRGRYTQRSFDIFRGYDCGMGIPYHEVKALACVLLPEIQTFVEGEDGQREYAEWKAKQQAEQENKE